MAAAPSSVVAHDLDAHPFGLDLAVLDLYGEDGNPCHGHRVVGELELDGIGLWSGLQIRGYVACGSIECGTLGHCRHRVNGGVNVCGDILLEHLLEVWRVCGASDEDEFREFAAIEMIALEELLADCYGLGKEGLHNWFGHLASDDEVEFELLAIVVVTEVAKVGEHLCAGSCGELYLSFLGKNLESLAQHV